MNSKELSEYFEEISISEKIQNEVAHLSKDLTDKLKKLKAEMYLMFNHALNFSELDLVQNFIDKNIENELIQSSHYLVCLYNKILCHLGVGFFFQGEIKKSFLIL